MTFFESLKYRVWPFYVITELRYENRELTKELAVAEAQAEFYKDQVAELIEAAKVTAPENFWIQHREEINAWALQRLKEGYRVFYDGPEWKQRPEGTEAVDNARTPSPSEAAGLERMRELQRQDQLANPDRAVPQSYTPNEWEAREQWQAWADDVNEVQRIMFEGYE